MNSKENKKFAPKSGNAFGEAQKLSKDLIRWEVFLPGILIFGLAAIIALINAPALADAMNRFFFWSLGNFGWLYTFVTLSSLLIVIILCFSKVGRVRIGGKDAKASMSFITWFTMALTGGIATGLVTWGVNEPIIYFGNVWGELDSLGIEPFSQEAYFFAIARNFMHWTFLPYAIYGLAGVLVAYLYFNKRQQLTVTATLEPLFGKRISGKVGSGIIDTLAMLALGLGITSGLAQAIILVTTGANTYTGHSEIPLSWIIVIGVVLVAAFTLSSSIGLDKGLRRLGWTNAVLFYGLMIFLLLIGPTGQIFRNLTAGLGTWFDNFFAWGLDPQDLGGAPLTTTWTMFHWAIWMAYAPVTAIFLAILSKGRTVREFLIVNWILPSVFGLAWFSIWGTNALEMQISGTADLAGVISETGSAVMGLWLFLQNLPFGLGTIILPLNIIVIAISYITAADATLTKLGSICVRDVPLGTQPPRLIKIIWGIVIGIVGIVLVGGAERLHGVSGVRELAAAGGFLVLFIFIFMIASAVKVFFIDKIEE